MNRNEEKRFYLMGNLNRIYKRCERWSRHLHNLKMANRAIVFVLNDRQEGIVVMAVMSVQRLAIQHAADTMLLKMMATAMKVEGFHAHHHTKRQ